MATKRNAALEALGAAPRKATTQVAEPEAPEAEPAPPQKSAKTVAKVMVYMPTKVARKFKEIAFTEDRKANDVYLEALDLYLQQQGHGGIKGVTGR